MTCDLSTHNRRKSYITLVRKQTTRTNSYFGQLNQGDLSTHGSEWKSAFFENSIVKSKVDSVEFEQRRRVSSRGDRNKENVSNNRGIIRIKPKKMMGNYHLMWCKDRVNRSQLIRLEREELTACDLE